MSNNKRVFRDDEMPFIRVIYNLVFWLMFLVWCVFVYLSRKDIAVFIASGMLVVYLLRPYNILKEVQTKL